MCGKLCLLLVAVLVISVVSTTDAARINRREVGNTVETTEAGEPDLETRINELKVKVANLVRDGIQNEKAFLDMTEQVKQMDDKVKKMIERLKKVNAADYLNGDVKNLN
ncbi:hypothetical protein CBL_02350 [Carabus blaptoides fortunei]